VIGGQPLLFQGVRGNVIHVTDEQQNKKRYPYPVLCVILEVRGGDLDILRFISLYIMWSCGVDAQEK
jgi:hypothetical protein